MIGRKIGSELPGKALLQEALSLCREMQFENCREIAIEILGNLGSNAFSLKDYIEARDYFLETYL